MPRENSTLNNTVETQTENSSSKDSLEQKIESLGKEIKSLRKQNRGIIGLGVIGLIGYIIATNWSAIAPASATAATATATVAAAPVIGIVIGTIIGAAVLVGASYAAWRYRAEIKAGFKYAAEKTVEGAKHTAGKIKAGAVYVKDSVKEAASSLKQAAREGTSSALEKMGEGVQNLGRKMSGIGASISDLERIPYSTEPQEPQGVVLLAKRELDPDLTDSNRDLERDSLQSNSLSRRSSMDSLNSASSTVGLLTGKRKEVNTFTSLKDKLPPWLGGKKAGKATEVKYPPLPKSDVPPSVKVGNSTFYVDLSEPPKAPESPTSGYGSKRSSPLSSGFSTPTWVQNPSLEKEFNEELAKRLQELSKSSSGSPTPSKLFKPPVPPKPLAGNLANEQKKQQGLSTPRSGSPDSGRGLSGPSTPTGRQSPPVKELLKLFDPLYGPNSSNNDISVTGVHHRRKAAV